MIHGIRRPIMATEQKKRARPVPKPSQRSKKRQKIDLAQNGTAKLERRAVALDALPWNEVEMPDMFEDAEGFFGLEEVEGVEVIREGDAVKFVRNAGGSITKDSHYPGDGSGANNR